MNILHLTPNYHPSTGGMQQVFRSVSERLVSAHGDDVTVLTTNAMQSPHARRIDLIPEAEETVGGVKVRRFAFMRWPRPPLKLALRATRWAPPPVREYLQWSRNGPISPGMLLATLHSDADVVASGSCPYLTMFYPIIARNIGKKLPFVYYGALHVTDGHVARPILAGIHRADAYVAFTAFERDVLIEHGIPEEKIRVVGLGVDVARIAGADGREFRARHGITDEPVVAFLGRLAPYKGVDTLLLAMREVWTTIPDARLLIAGVRGDSADLLDELIASLTPSERERLIFQDRYIANAPELFAACDVFVTVSSQESFGLVYLEAWAAGKPVVGGRIGAVASVIAEGENGLLVPCADVGSLAAALRTLLGDEALRKRLGRTGRAKVDRDHDWPIVTDRLRAIYQSVR